MTLLHLLASFATIVVLCTAIPSDVDWLEVVPRFENLENFYQQTRLENGKLYDMSEQTTSPYVKSLVCWNLFASNIFDSNNVEGIEMNMNWVYYELKWSYPDILSSLYEDIVPESPHEFGHHRYVNPTKVVNLTLAEGTVPEYVFTCIGRNRLTGKVLEYYVSEEYNVSKKKLSYVAGRFMFGTIDGQMKVMYYAQEPATILTKVDYNMEYLYLQARGNKELASTPDDDPLCKLNVNEKIQVCTSVLSAEYFDEMLDFVPDDDAVSEKCFKWKVALADKMSPYEEWMMQCTATAIDGTSILYFLSQAYSPGEVFIYRTRRRAPKTALDLEYLSINVGGIQQ